MKESVILKIALIFSLIGLIMLYFISDNIGVKEYSARINSDIGEDVKLKGVVKSIRKGNNTAFIEIEQNLPLGIVLFENKNINLTQGDFVEVIGEVQDYNGKEEVIANRIRVVEK